MMPFSANVVLTIPKLHIILYLELQLLLDANELYSSR